MKPKVAQPKSLIALVVMLGIAALGVVCAGGDGLERSTAPSVSPQK